MKTTTINYSAYTVPGLVVYRPEQFGERIFNYTAQFLGENSDKLSENVVKRQATIAVMYVFTNMTLAEIGQKFNRHHTTVIYAINKVNDLFSIGDKLMMDEVKRLFLLCYKDYRQCKANYQILTKGRMELIDTITYRLNSVQFAKDLTRRKRKKKSR